MVDRYTKIVLTVIAASLVMLVMQNGIRMAMASIDYNDACGTPSWRYVFGPMTEHFKDRSAASITPDEAQQWINGLINPGRSARTVDTNWITASKTVFGWAAEHKHIPRNPFADVNVTIPKRIKLRETQASRPQERRTILKAAPLHRAVTDKV
jgi:hypothetical protein